MMQGSTVCREEKTGVRLYSNHQPVNKNTRQVPACSRRLLDLCLAGLALFLGLPFLFLIILAIKYDSPGPAIFKQHRLGFQGRKFCCYKFRSMYWRQPEILEKYLSQHPEHGEEWVNYAKLQADPRITKMGRWLRRFSLDELPQLFNVIRGDMRLIGPRPYLPSERERMGEYAGIILSVPPGLSGLWQVSGRNDIDFAGRIALDVRYVKARSRRMDLFILGRTLPVVIKGKGAY